MPDNGNIPQHTYRFNIPKMLTVTAAAESKHCCLLSERNVCAPANYAAALLDETTWIFCHAIATGLDILLLLLLLLLLCLQYGMFSPVRGVINECCQNLQGCFCSCMQANSVFEVADTSAVCTVH